MRIVCRLGTDDGEMLEEHGIGWRLWLWWDNGPHALGGFCRHCRDER